MTTNSLTCECCGRSLDEHKAVWLELDTRTGEYTSGPVPEEASQGGFLFGVACARKADSSKTKVETPK